MYIKYMEEISKLYYCSNRTLHGVSDKLVSDKRVM